MKATEAKSTSYPSSWPTDLRPGQREELEKRMKHPILSAHYGGDERLNRRVLVKVQPNYITAEGGAAPENAQNHEIQVNGASIWYRYNEWCALPICAVEVLTHRYDNVTLKFIPAVAPDGVDQYEGGRNEIVKHKKFSVQVWEEDLLPFRPWMPDAKDREKKAAA